MRLLAGVLAGHPFSSTIVGDASLSRRPMRRVMAPLERMGARIEAVDGHAPVTIHGGALHGIAHTSEVPSAQVKSAVLLAWDGVAFTTLTAALALAGYRVTNRMGHHRAAVDASRYLLGEDALMSRIGSLRRMRDRGMYEMDPPDVHEITEALDDCEQLIELVARAVQRASTR